MDQNALKFIQDRQAVLRDAYNSYKLQFSTPKGPAASNRRLSSGPIDINGGQGNWVWFQWDDNDTNAMITECLEKERNVGVKSGVLEPNHALEDEINKWINAFLSDTGSMFRLYRKGGFKVDGAIISLRDALKFRIQYRRELLWSPMPQVNGPDASNFEKVSSLQGSKRSRRGSVSSMTRTSAQSPRASPAPRLNNTDLISSSRTGEGTKRFCAKSLTETLIQLYPYSSMDPNRRPIIVVSLKYIDDFSNPTRQPNGDRKLSAPSLASPKTQALAAFERLRCNLAENTLSGEKAGPNHLDPLQFILIIDLAGGRVSATAWDMVKWLIRDGADQFHGMCSSVFVVNYSWEFGALWSFAKHMLPAPAKARVIFPTVEELLEYLGENALPPSLGGSCTSTLPYYPSPITVLDPLPLTALEMPLLSSTRSPTPNGATPLGIHTPRKPLHTRRTYLRYLHSTSHENPYYGYPATIEEGVDSHGRPIRIQHSRRRKRDLVRTLMWLLLLRCRARIASLPKQLKYLAWRLVHGRWSTLVILIVVTVSVSLTCTRELRRGWNYLCRRISGRIT